MRIEHDLDPAGPDMTVQELADCTGRSPRTVYRWLTENRLPGSYLLAGTWKIPQRVVLDSLISIPSESTDSPE